MIFDQGHTPKHWNGTKPVKSELRKNYLFDQESIYRGMELSNGVVTIKKVYKTGFYNREIRSLSVIITGTTVIKLRVKK